jgi:acyl-CoA synthetase (AMP-forming)/AMP-acid ligase II
VPTSVPESLAAAGVIHRSIYPDPVIPEADLPSFVLEHAGAWGDRPALVDGLTGETVTYGELPGRVAAVAALLATAGLRAGDVVALMASNQPRWAVAYYGVLLAGGVVTPLNPALTPGEVEHLLGLSAARVIVADVGAAAGAAQAAAATGLPMVTLEALTTGGGPSGLAGLVPSGLCLEPPITAPDAQAAEEPAPDRVAVVAYSSGTTGLPKGVLLTHRNLVATLCQHEPIYHVGPDDVFLATPPFFHIYGLSIILSYAIRHGAKVVTMARFDPARYLSLVAEHHVTWLHVAPPMVLLLISEQGVAADLSSVRHVISGAAPLDAGITARAEARLGCLIGQGFGLTEASPGITWLPDDGSVPCPPGSVGVLVAGTEARVVDPGTLDDVEVGELWVRGPQVMAGYLDAPEATAATLVEGGWLRTGDIVRVDDTGAWWVVDRLKELIKYKGYQVAPAELEGLLLDHPAVIDAAVVGLPDLAAGEIPVAWVVTRHPLDETELLTWVAQRVAPYKKLRGIRFVESIPRSATGKILRRALRVEAVSAPS